MAGWRCGDHDRIDMWQGFVEIRVRRDVVIRLLEAAVDLGEPLIYGDDRCYTGRGPQYPYVPRTPITYSDDADPNSVRSYSHFAPPCWPGYAP